MEGDMGVRNSICASITLMLAVHGGWAAVPAHAQDRHPAPNNDSSNAELQIDWQVPQSEAAKVTDGPGFQWKVVSTDTVGTTKGGPILLVVLAGVILLPYLSDRLVRVYKGARYGGSIV